MTSRIRNLTALAAFAAAFALPACVRASDVTRPAPLDANAVTATVPAQLRSARIVGAIAPHQELSLNVHLRYPHPDEVRAVVAALNDPESPMYGRFLSPAQFVANFAPAQATYTELARDLGHAGFRVTRTWSNRRYLTVRGEAASIERFFHTRIARVAYGDRIHFVNVAPAVAPPALRGIVSAVTGLDDFELHSHYRVHPNVTAPIPVPNPPVGASAPPALSAAVMGYSPQQIQTAYDYPISKNPLLTGAGVTIAIEAAYGFSPADLYAFWEIFGINRTGSLTQYDADGSVPPPLDPDASAEVTLDIEQSSSAAPGANIKVYSAPIALSAFLQDQYNAVVGDGTVDIVTTSFGGCEIDATPSNVGAENDIFEQGSAEGQTMFAAAGDNGSSDCGSNTVDTVDFPASSTEVGAAGGTTLKLTAANAIASEVSWSCGAPSATTGEACPGGAGGGGVSGYFSLPSWQKGITTEASTTARNVPDVALDADPATPYAAVFFGSATEGYGGTSIVAPNLAGVYAEFEQYGHHRLGRSSTTLYYAHKKGLSPYANGFHDITSGDNIDTRYSDSVGFASKTGFDDTTGWGSLDAYRLMQSLPAIAGGSNL